jgi:hypothetical protein
MGLISIVAPRRRGIIPSDPWDESHGYRQYIATRLKDRAITSERVVNADSQKGGNATVAERPMMVAGAFKPRIHVPDLSRRGATVEKLTQHSIASNKRLHAPAKNSVVSTPATGSF